MFFLAELPAPTKDEFWPVLLSLAALMGIISGALGIIVKVRQLKNGGQMDIKQPFEIKKAAQHAEQSDLDALTETVNGMREEITAQFRAAQQAGEGRVSAITQNIDAEIGALAIKLSNLASVLHEKINGTIVDNARQGADIGHLQTETFRHAGEIAAIRNAIQDLLRSGTKAKH